MNRRDFLRTTTGIAGAGAVSGAASPVAAQEQTTTEESSSNTTTSGEGTETAEGGTATEASGGGGGGGTETVQVGPGGDYVYTPGTEEPLVIAPGTTVKFVWESDNHNVVVDSQPEGAGWEGHEALENTGFSFSSTFDTVGTYEYYCEPHRGLGMEATIEVKEGGAQEQAAPAETEVDPEEMGVAIQAHFVGIATILMIIVSLVYSFFFLKYGESPNSSSPK